MIIQGNDIGQKSPELIIIQLAIVNMTEGIALLFGTALFLLLFFFITCGSKHWKRKENLSSFQ